MVFVEIGHFDTLSEFVIKYVQGFAYVFRLTKKNWASIVFLSVYVVIFMALTNTLVIKAVTKMCVKYFLK